MCESDVGAEKKQPPPTDGNESVLVSVICDLTDMSKTVDNNGPTANLITRIVEDLAARAAVGEAKYGTMLMAHNGRDAAMDAYQELLDAAMYVRQLIIELPTRVSVFETNMVINVYRSILDLCMQLRSAMEEETDNNG